MINRASGSSALILAAGLLVLLTSPAMAAGGDDSAAGATSGSQAAPAARNRAIGHVPHHRRHYAHRRVHEVAKAVEEKADDEKASAPAVATDNRTLQEMPPSIANANAQMLLAGAQISAAAAIPQATDNRAKPFETAGADETVIAASDQLNDADRTLQEGSSTAAATMSPAPAAPVATMTGDSTVWDQTSLIGKIFIGFGALLTMASAARMFIT